MMDGIVPYDPRAVPSTSALQRPAMAAPQYSVGTSYAESPVTPMSASPYGSQGHFGEYSSCTYQSPTVPSTTSAFQQLPQRVSQRPLAPPTPPLDDERGMRLDSGRSAYPIGGACRRPSRRSVSVVKSEVGPDAKEIKTVPKFVKTDGSLQYQSNKPIDVLLRLSEVVIGSDRVKGGAETPESMASPPPVKEVFRYITAQSKEESYMLTHGIAETGTSQAREKTCMPGQGVWPPVSSESST